MQPSSALGLAVEKTIESDPRFWHVRGNVQYASFFKTLSGTAFLVEGRTINHVNLWIPETEAAKTVAEGLGLSVVRSVPRLDPSKYGRLSALRSIPELANQPLWKIPVHRPEQALAVLGALP
jgi:hypothetical protein